MSVYFKHLTYTVKSNLEKPDLASANINTLKNIKSVAFMFENKKNFKKSGVGKACVLALLVNGMFVHSAYADGVESKPYSVGDFEVFGRLDVGLGYNDNAFRGSIVEESTTILTVNPTISAIRETASNRISFDYRGEGSVFFESSDDDFISTELGAQYVAKISANSELGFGVRFEDGNSVRGTDFLEGTNSIVDGPTEFENVAFTTNYFIGSEKVGPVLELGFEYSDLEFQNFELFTQGRDRSTIQLSARLGYQYSVATQFFVDVNYRDLDYDGVINNFPAGLDNDETRVEVGIKWRATSQTSGEISVGVTDKDFDDFEDVSTITSWNAAIEWNPSSRDKVTFETFSRPFEQTGTGLFIDVEEYSISWNHSFSSRWNFNASFATGSSDFEANPRDDDYDSYGLGFNYRPSRFSAIALNYSREDKDSSAGVFDFDSNALTLTYSTSL